MSSPFPKRELWLVGILAFIGLVVLPCLNAFVPPDNLFHVGTFTLSLYGKYLTYAVLALGVNLLWGYTGILSLGQCLFFSLGGYALGMHLMLMIGNLGQYKAGLALQDAAHAVELDESIEEPHLNQRFTGIQAAIAVASTVAKRKQRHMGPHLGNVVEAAAHPVQHVLLTKDVAP